MSLTYKNPKSEHSMAPIAGMSGSAHTCNPNSSFVQLGLLCISLNGHEVRMSGEADCGDQPFNQMNLHLDAVHTTKK